MHGTRLPEPRELTPGIVNADPDDPIDEAGLADAEEQLHDHARAFLRASKATSTLRA